MSKVLYIETSPRKIFSRSIEVSKYFLDLYKKKYPNDSIRVFNLWKEKLPVYNEELVVERYRIMEQKDYVSGKKSWQKVINFIDEFKSYDKYVISSPMWNFNVPFKLKNLIDILCQPTQTFSYNPKDGYLGLITGKPVVLILARGGEYPPGTPLENIDFQKKYLEFYLGIFRLY